MLQKNRSKRKLIFRSFMSDPEFLATSKARDELLARGMVARFARGNIALRNGAFVTAEELEREREDLKSVKFSPKN